MNDILKKLQLPARRRHTPEQFIVQDDEPIAGLSILYQPHEQKHTEQTVSSAKDAADALFEMGIISEQQLAVVRYEQKNGSEKDVGRILRHLDFVCEDDILRAQAGLCGFEFRHITSEQVQKNVFEMLSMEYVRANRIMAVRCSEKNLIVATSRPTDVFTIDEVRRITGCNLEVVVCGNDDIDSVCAAFEANSFTACVDDIISDMSDVEVVQDARQEVEDLAKIAGESPVIKFVNYVISNAIREKASDIHIEPKGDHTKIRYRIDGVLFETMSPPAKMHPAVVSRLKIMSNLDISERRLPQDGKITVIVGGRNIDLRVSILPTSHGEKVVIRILDSKSVLRGLDNSGMEPAVIAKFRDEINKPHGIALVTGPTGSGKSTTLYGALCEMDGKSMNISTVEDPVEYELNYANQVGVNEAIGMTFSAALRSLLRQDPDIIMVGEIRDNETARIAVQAALTGHLVLSTLHTNDAPSSITRLVNIGIDAYLIAASLNAVLAQRLVRTICQKCKQPYIVPDSMKRYIEAAGIEQSRLYHGAGCENCRGSGYQGRTGIYELLVVDEKFRDIINSDSSVNAMRRAFRQSGAATLYDDGIIKVKKGLTTLEEVLRVTQVYGKNELEVFEENIT